MQKLNNQNILKYKIKKYTYKNKINQNQNKNQNKNQLYEAKIKGYTQMLKSMSGGYTCILCIKEGNDIYNNTNENLYECNHCGVVICSECKVSINDCPYCKKNDFQIISKDDKKYKIENLNFTKNAESVEKSEEQQERERKSHQEFLERVQAAQRPDPISDLEDPFDPHALQRRDNSLDEDLDEDQERDINNSVRYDISQQIFANNYHRNNNSLLSEIDDELNIVDEIDESLTSFIEKIYQRVTDIIYSKFKIYDNKQFIRIIERYPLTRRNYNSLREYTDENNENLRQIEEKREEIINERNELKNRIGLERYNELSRLYPKLFVDLFTGDL
jgi:hypothetical protein